jgi:hypothetical protein
VKNVNGDGQRHIVKADQRHLLDPTLETHFSRWFYFVLDMAFVVQTRK